MRPIKLLLVSCFCGIAAMRAGAQVACETAPDIYHSGCVGVSVTTSIQRGSDEKITGGTITVTASPRCGGSPLDVGASLTTGSVIVDGTPRTADANVTRAYFFGSPQPNAIPGKAVTGLSANQSHTLVFDIDVAAANSALCMHRDANGDWNGPWAIANGSSSNVYTTAVPFDVGAAPLTDDFLVSSTGGAGFVIGGHQIRHFDASGSALAPLVGALNVPRGGGADSSGNLYIANYGSGNIKKIDPAGHDTVFAAIASPFDLAVDGSGNVFVVAGGTGPSNHKIAAFNSAGTELGEMIVSATPLSIALDNSGNIYVGFDNNTVEKYGSNGADLGTVATNTTGIALPLGLAYDSGFIYVANFNGAGGPGSVTKYDVTTFGQPAAATLMGPNMSGPQDVAFDSSHALCVSNRRSGKIERYSTINNSDLGTLGTTNTPFGLIFVGTNLFVVSNNHNQIVRFDTSASPTTPTLFFRSNLSFPSGIAFDRAGRLYVANYGLSSIDRFDATGNYLGTFANTASQPMGLAFDASGNLFVSNFLNNTVSKIDSNGMETPFANGFDHPIGLAFDPNGNLYVANQGNNTGGVGTVAKCTAAGVCTPFVTSAVTSAQSGRYPASLAFDSSGNLYVSYQGSNPGDTQNAVTEYDSTGAFVKYFANNDPSAATPLLRSPYGLTFDSAGNLYVVNAADYGQSTANGYVLKIDRGGAAASTLVSFASGTLVNPSFIISRGNPTLTTTASAATTFGGTISDSAFLSGGANPGGTVTFKAYGPDDAACGGTPVFSSSVSVSPNASANSGQFSPASPGTYRFVASYGGDARNRFASGSCGDAAESVVVGKADQTVTFGSLSDRTYGDPSFDVSATASSGLPVTFSIVSGPATISGRTISITGTGAVTVRASQSGDNNYNAATNVDRSFNVAKADQTITFGAISDKTFGDPDFTVSATSSSGLPVGLSASGSATITGSTVHMTGAGPSTITATQAGDSNYNAAPAVVQSFSVANANQTITFGAISNKTFGDPDFAVSAASSSGLAVSFSASGSATVTGSTVHMTGAGPSTITATQAGNSNYNAAPAVAQSFTVAKAATSVSVSASLNPSKEGESVTFTAGVGSSASGPATGTVQFKNNGAHLGDPQPLNSGASVTFSTSALPAGNHEITAEYGGDANFASSTGSLAGGQVVDAVPAQSQNISTRLKVLGGDNVLIGGFIITGTSPKKVILRAIGPSLGLDGALADPTLELHLADKSVVTNDNWKVDEATGQSQEAEIRATTIPPANELESAMVQTLAPGAYTVIIKGKDGGTGIGLVEVYDLDGAAPSKLANISTRGFVDTDNNVMIGGFIIGPNNASSAKVAIRAIGPSLTAAGVPEALQDPTLELHDGSGTKIAFNDNWQDDAGAAEVKASKLDPQDPRESVLLRVLPPGAYTAIVAGSGSTTGVGLVEVYSLQ